MRGSGGGQRGGSRGSLVLLLVDFGALDDFFDYLFLLLALLAITPPDRSLVFANEAKVSTCTAVRLALLALFTTKSANEAAYERRVQCQIAPVRCESLKQAE